MKRFLTILFALTCFTALWADDVRFEVSGSKQAVQGQQFQLEYTLYNASGKDFRRPEFPAGCRYLYEAESSGMTKEMKNGVWTQQTTKSYIITVKAEKEGNYTIPPASIKVNGRTYQTSSWKLEVLSPDKSPETRASDTRAFARLELSSSKTYRQEPILATLKLYMRAEPNALPRTIFPSFEGFLVQEMNMPQGASFGQEVYNGEHFYVGTIKQWLLFPQRDGKIEIEPGEMDVELITYEKVPSVFGGYSHVPQLVTRTVTIPGATVEVLPLPSGKPASFGNGVGVFTMSSDISMTHTKANEAITYTLKIEGTGNLEHMKIPEVKFPNDFEVYDPEDKKSVKEVGATIKGSRTIEYTLIPRFEGTFEIPAVEFSYFDTQSKQYKTLTTQSYTITVDKADATNVGTGSANYSNKEDVKLLNQDIRYIKTKPLTLSKDAKNYIDSWLYWLWYIVPALLFVLFIFINRKQARANANVTLMKTRKANKVASKRLKIAGRYLKNHDRAHFYDEVLKAVWGYLSDKLSLPLSELTKDNVSAELERFGANPQLIETFNDILGRCEFARYAPSQSDEAMDELYRQTLDAIGRMENIKEINKNRPMNKTYIGLLLLLMSFSAHGQEALTNAHEAFGEGDYATAITLYEQVAQDNGVSPDLYYNLGNAYFKSGQYARAILNYERALLLNPAHDDARFNLELANARIVDKIDTLDRFFLSVWLDSFRNILSSNGWAVVGIVTFLLFILGVYLYIFSRSIPVKKIGFFGGIVVLLLSIAANCFAWGLNSKMQAHNEAIVLATAVSVKGAPAADGTELFVLHEGTKVTIVNEVNNWTEVQLSDGNRGWLPTQAIEII